MKRVSWAVAIVVVISLFGMVLVGCGGTTTTTKAPETTTTAAGGKPTTTTAEATTTTAGKPVELKVAFFAPEAAFPGQSHHGSTKELQKATNGQVTVKWFPGGTLLTAQNMYDGVLERA